MGDKRPASDQPDNPRMPSLASTGRSIADDLIIETLVQVVIDYEAMPMAKALVNLLIDGFETTFDKYLENRWGPDNIGRLGKPQVREECEVRLKYIRQELRAASSFFQTPQPPSPFRPRPQDNQDQS